MDDHSSFRHSAFTFKRRSLSPDDQVEDSCRSRVPPAMRWPLRLAALGLGLYLLLSDNLLVTLGIPYNVPGGAFPFKIHPGTYCIALGFVLLLRGNPWRQLCELFRLSPPLTSLALTTTVIMVYAAIQFGTSGTGFFIDTLLAPTLLGLLLLRAPVAQRQTLFWVALVLLSLNAVVGIGEALAGKRLTPYMAGGEVLVEDFFRATSLGGHPLGNALRTSVMLFAALILPLNLRVPLILLFTIALLAFGSRAALAISGLLLALWAGARFMSDLNARRIEPPLALGVAALALLAPVVLVAIAAQLGLGERIVHEFRWDDSAQSRLLAFKIFDYASPQELLWGMGPARIEWSLDQLKHSTILNDIENFWILLLLQVGIIPFLFLAGALLSTLASLAWRQPMPLRLAVLVFLVLTSSNNSLATKSQSLAILVAIMLGAAAVARCQQAPQALQAPRTTLTVADTVPSRMGSRFRVLARSRSRETH